MKIPSLIPGPEILSSPWKERLNAPFPYYFNNDWKNSLVIAGISLFLMIFMITFEPASQYYKILIVGGVTFSILFLNIIILPQLFPYVFDILNWTIGKYILFTIWQFVTIGTILTYTLFLLGFHPGETLTQTFLDVYPRVLSHGVIPITIVTILLRNRMLQENLRNARSANQELDRIKMLKEDVAHEKTGKLTIYSDTKETLNLALSDLLYVEANENYSTLYWRDGHGIEKTMLRINLKNVEIQLDNHFTIRCHRSFIVNISAIDHVSGNANGYKLGIRDTKFSVPVSRSKGKEVIDKIEQLRNMFELT